jgi:hypothetical protein
VKPTLKEEAGFIFVRWNKRTGRQIAEDIQARGAPFPAGEPEREPLALSGCPVPFLFYLISEGAQSPGSILVASWTSDAGMEKRAAMNEHDQVRCRGHDPPWSIPLMGSEEGP